MRNTYAFARVIKTFAQAAREGGFGADRDLEEHCDQDQDQVSCPDIDEPEPVIAAALDQHEDRRGVERAAVALRPPGQRADLEDIPAADALEERLVLGDRLLRKTRAG